MSSHKQKRKQTNFMVNPARIVEHMKRVNAGPETLHKLLITNYEQNKLIQTTIVKKKNQV